MPAIWGRFLSRMEKGYVMFTGIVTDIGTIEEYRKLKKGVRLSISSRDISESIEVGASIACSGICLTVVSPSESVANANMQLFEVEAWEETLRLSTLSFWSTGTRINLERALKLGNEMGGHFVSGHVDGVAEIQFDHDEGEARRLEIKVPDHLIPFIAPKGSICLNGTSLTVNHVNGSVLDVLLIRHTLDVTTWGECKVGDLVNIEVDYLARYIARMIECAKAAAV